MEKCYSAGDKWDDQVGDRINRIFIPIVQPADYPKSAGYAVLDRLRSQSNGTVGQLDAQTG